MKDVTLTPQPAAQVQPFSSLEALRIAHDELLDRIDQTGETPELWEQSTALVWRVQRTGALLDRSLDRRSAQSILDYWAGLLYRGKATCRRTSAGRV